jgi:hypothetical protein
MSDSDWVGDWDGEHVHEQQTPNGWVIAYRSEPRRYYEIDRIEADCSVSEPLKVLDKPALPWWGQNVGVKAVLDLHRLGVTTEMLLQGKPHEMEMIEWAKLISKGVLTEHKLTVNHIRDEAGTRGQTVHDALSFWATTGHMPKPEEFPTWEQGYVISLCAFLRDVPSLTPVGTELMVGSKTHSFAGRYDLRAVTEADHRVVTKTYPKAGAKTVTVPRGEFLIDAKTASDVFAEHDLQLAAYEGASIESGYSPTDGRIVLQLGADGRYQARRARATLDDWLAVKHTWQILRRVEDNLKIAYR